MAKVALKEGLYKQNAELQDVLVGSFCQDCGEKFFPIRQVCAKCSSQNLTETELAREGELVTYAIVRQTVPTWQGPIPYIIAQVKLDDGPDIMTHLNESADEVILIGSRVELNMAKLKEDREGNEVMAHMFKFKGGRTNA